MSRSIRFALCFLLTLALGIPAMAWAQAVPRGSTSSGSTSSGSGSSGSSGSTSSGGSSSGSSTESAPPPPPPPVHVRTPPPDSPRTGNAVPRGSSSSNKSDGSNSGSARPAGGAISGDSSATSSSGDATNDPRSRSRNGRVISGVATSRENVAGGGGDLTLFGPWGRYAPWYSGGYGYVTYSPWMVGDTRWNWYRYGSWYNPYSIYGYYDPWYDTWYDPYYYGGGYYSSYGGSVSSSRSSRSEERETTGSVRIKVKPSQAKVYLDGTLIGTVEEFDGLTGHLAAPAGTHQLEFRADGYQPLTTTVQVEAGKTITARAGLKKK